jgi:uncharacterized protein (DUF1697 family)
MQTYFAFLRAINVGGHSVIKMDALKKMFESAGMKKVKTYIQSGNVIFESAEKNEGTLRKKIEKHLAKSLGYEVVVLLRSFSDLENVAAINPFEKIFSELKTGKEAMIYVAFFNETPDKTQANMLKGLSTKTEIYQLKGRELFCLCYRDAKGSTQFSNNFIEKKLGVKATTRNMNTINKMIALKE